jgi:hypothetical protein
MPLAQTHGLQGDDRYGRGTREQSPKRSNNTAKHTCALCSVLAPVARHHPAIVRDVTLVAAAHERAVDVGARRLLGACVELPAAALIDVVAVRAFEPGVAHALVRPGRVDAAGPPAR